MGLYTPQSLCEGPWEKPEAKKGKAEEFYSLFNQNDKNSSILHIPY